MQKTELLYLNETIKATDALQNGLITKVFNSDIFESEIVHQTEQIAQQSSQVILLSQTIHSEKDKQFHCKIIHAFFHLTCLLSF